MSHLASTTSPAHAICPPPPHQSLFCSKKGRVQRSHRVCSDEDAAATLEETVEFLGATLLLFAGLERLDVHARGPFREDLKPH